MRLAMTFDDDSIERMGSFRRQAGGDILVAYGRNSRAMNFSPTLRRRLLRALRHFRIVSHFGAYY